VHAATEELPAAPPVVVTPAGHAVQAAAPDADEYAPAGQGAHEGVSPPAHAQLPSTALRTSVTDPKLPEAVHEKA